MSIIDHESLLNGAAGGGLSLAVFVFFGKRYLSAFETTVSTMQKVQVELGKIVLRLDMREKDSELIREMQTEIAVLKSIVHGKQSRNSPTS